MRTIFIFEHLSGFDVTEAAASITAAAAPAAGAAGGRGPAGMEAAWMQMLGSDQLVYLRNEDNLIAVLPVTFLPD